MRRLLPLLALLLSVAAPARAQQAATLDSLAQAFFEKQESMGMVVGVVTPDGRRVRSHGQVGLRKKAAPDEASLFEAGSITKVLTALLLADMARSGEVTLDDPIGRYLPDSVNAPTYEGQPITLKQLATHTSGLPRLPTNLAPTNIADPYADYTAADLHSFLDDYELRRAPGSQYEYSNLGGGLLGHLLARAADASYGTLVERRVLEPLGMDDSYVAGVDSASLAGRGDLMPGYGPTRSASPWHFDALAGAGGLRSTARDLLALLSAQIGLSEAGLRPAMQSTQAVQYKASGERPSLGLAWHVSHRDGRRLYWHNGGTGGFRGFIGFEPETQTGLVVLANSALPVTMFTQFGLRALTRAGGER